MHLILCIEQEPSEGANVEKLAIWALTGLLAYICVILTSIDNKIDTLNMHNAQYATLNEVKPQSYTGDDVHQILYNEAMPYYASPAQAGLLIAGILSIFISWHISRIYYTHQWTKRILRKSFAHFSEPHVMMQPREALHKDQDCVGDAPLPDGRIKASWLPPHARQLYSDWTMNRNKHSGSRSTV